MRRIHLGIGLVCIPVSGAEAANCVAPDEQCGGQAYSGSTCCWPGHVCQKVSAYYSACARAWHNVTGGADVPPARGLNSLVLDAATSRLWLFGGAYQRSRLNDLHYFDIEAKIWHPVAAGNAPSRRCGHSAVLDAKSRMWIFGGEHVRRDSYPFRLKLNDLHYFDVEVAAWYPVRADNPPSVREGHTAVLDAKQRMWIFAGFDRDQYFNDLHYFDVEARVWQPVNAENAPAKRISHTAVLDSMQRMWIFGGKLKSGDVKLNDLHYFDVEARTWHFVAADHAPAARTAHSAVLDGQQRMWIFGGTGGFFGSKKFNDLHYFDIEAGTWHGVPGANAPAKRVYHTAVLDPATQRMWVFGGLGGYVWSNDWFNDLQYFDLEVATSSTWTSTSSSSTTTSSSTNTTSSTTSSRTSSTTSSSTTSTGFVLEVVPQKTDDFPQIRPPPSADGLPVEITGFPTEQPAAAVDGAPTSQSEVLRLILIPGLLACLAVCLSIFCFWTKKRRGRQAQAELGPVLPLSSDPGAMLPASIRPLIFAWDGRMTAEWPRGKVLKLEVAEDAFAAGGQRYQLQCADDGVKSFSWADGTVQEVESIRGNVVHWVTQHPHSEWQRFRWVCSPQCAANGLHDMEVRGSKDYRCWGSKAYRCKSCSCSRPAENHWCCLVHKEHLCPTCAELPPTAPTLGVAAQFLADVFPPMARSATSSDNPNFYEMCPLIAHGDQGLGFGQICPRDGQPNCSIVDALEDVQSGKVTHFVSWCWAYRLNDVVTALSRWLRKSGGDPTDIFLWMCFFCNNQYRILQEAKQTGSEDLKGIFEKHLAAAGRMLVLLDDIQQPTYVSRAWCIFESYVCIQQNFSMEILLPTSAQGFFREALSSGGGGIEELTRAVSSLDVRDAKASQRADEELIKKLIFNDIGFDAVNQAVRARLVDELGSLFREILMPRPR